MTTYMILDHGDEYEMKANSAKEALIKWIDTYHNAEVIELISEEEEAEYLARLKIIKL